MICDSRVLCCHTIGFLLILKLVNKEKCAAFDGMRVDFFTLFIGWKMCLVSFIWQMISFVMK